MVRFCALRSRFWLTVTLSLITRFVLRSVRLSMFTGDVGNKSLPTIVTMNPLVTVNVLVVGALVPFGTTWLAEVRFVQTVLHTWIWPLHRAR